MVIAASSAIVFLLLFSLIVLLLAVNAPDNPEVQPVISQARLYVDWDSMTVLVQHYQNGERVYGGSLQSFTDSMDIWRIEYELKEQGYQVDRFELSDLKTEATVDQMQDLLDAQQEIMDSQIWD